MFDLAMLALFAVSLMMLGKAERRRFSGATPEKL
jgi:hypothetical protein